MVSMVMSKTVQGEEPHDAALCGLAQQASEGDDGGHARAVEEEQGGQALEAEGIAVVRQVVGRLPLHVQQQTPEQPGGVRHTAQRRSWLPRRPGSLKPGNPEARNTRRPFTSEALWSV